MYEPRFTYTDRLVFGLIKLEAQKTLLQNHDLEYSIKSKLAHQIKSLDLFHLSHLLGLEITIKDAEKIASGLKLENIDELKWKIITNFRNILEFSRSNIADTYAEVDFGILLHIHKLIAGGWKENWELRFRNISDNIDETADNWVNFKESSIDAAQIEQEVTDLINWYKDHSPTMAPIVRIGIFLFRMMEIYPYVAGNKLTILAMADYLFMKNNPSGKTFLSVIRLFNVHEQKLIEAYQMSKVNYDISFWLEAFTYAILKDFSEARESLGEFLKEDEKSKSQPFLDLNKRQLKVLRYLQTVPMIKREDYCHMMEVSTMTAFRDLNDLVRKKLIKVEGQGRGTKYRLSSM